MNYKPDIVYSTQELFVHVQNLELHKLIPMKNQLKYDMLDNEERYELIQSISVLNEQIQKLYDLVELRYTKPL